MREDRDELAQVGLGAMIVFIGSLLAITSSAYVMIQQLEVIAQTSQKTISVATNEAHTQIVFVGGWVDDAFDDYLLMIEFQSLGEEVITDEIAFVTDIKGVCKEGLTFQTTMYPTKQDSTNTVS